MFRFLALFATFWLAALAAISPLGTPEFCSQNITSSCNTTLSYISQVNQVVRPHIVALAKMPYFRYFKLDLDKQCRFWDAQHFCVTENCAVEVLPEYNWTEVSSEHKPLKLGQINRPQATGGVSDDSETCEDLDYCHLDDDHHCVFVDLLENPERFTGYGGSQAHDVWHAIYAENCFPNTNPMSMTENGAPEQCVEKNLFYRMISGMHSSISVHLSNEYMLQTGEFYPDLAVFMARVGSFNDRLSNVFFNYALVSQLLIELSKTVPVAKLAAEESEQRLLTNEDADARDEYGRLLDDVVSKLAENQLFDTSLLFKNTPTLKEEFRARFKNVSAIMDCVGCDRCRMWGKLQTIGYGTAMKILFEGENHAQLKFRRIELVALFNTFERLSKSVEAIDKFKQMYLDHLEDVSKGLVQPGNYDSAESRKHFDFPFMSTPNLPIAAKDSSKSDVKRAPQKPKIAKPVPRKKRTFSEEFKASFDEVMEALKFVLSSYYKLPVLLYQYAVVIVAKVWKIFIGVDPTWDYYTQSPLFDDYVE